jgi:hypothetical protein
MTSFTVQQLAILSGLVLGALTLGAQPPGRSGPPLAPGRVSPHETVSAAIGGFNGPRVTITYGRPFSKNPRPPGEIRKIFGGLVPYGQADRMGADEATTLITQKPLVFGSTVVPAGTYTLYWVVNEDGTAKLAFSRNVGKWGIPVDDKSDVARVDFKRSELPAQIDQLTIAVENTPTGGVIKASWEKSQFAAEFTVRE